MICFRAFNHDDPAATLAAAVDGIRSGQIPADVFHAEPETFRRIPNTPFAYWVPETLSRVFQKHEAFETNRRRVRQGGVTGNDTKYLRAWWEVAPKDAAPNEIQWVPFAKGGNFSPFYADVPMVVRWDFKRSTFFSYTGLPHRPSEKPSSADSYFSRGLTWPLRAHRFAPVPLPSNSVFSIRGYAILTDDEEELLPLLAVGNSAVFDFIFKLALGRFGFPEFVVGVLQQLPLPLIGERIASRLADNAQRAWKARRELDTVKSTSHAFLLPALLVAGGSTLNERADAWTAGARTIEGSVAENQAEIDELALELFGFSSADREALSAGSSDEQAEEADSTGSDDDEEERDDVDTSALVAEVVSFALGTAFGRWDIRYATGERQPPESPDPFDPLPVCPPGMLQNSEGLPAEPKDVPAGYPLRISWPGILVDDENHPGDIVAHVREAIEVIWKDRAEAIEQEACGILGVKTLRDYFRRPAAFFADQLKRYSKSRRQAPIYWPLSTKSGSYTLWLYYHRLTDQTLHTCLADFLDPKLRKVQSELDALTASGGGGTRAGELREFLDELHDLRDEIERVIKLPWKPNLNDGVLITASPLHKLFRLPKWQKDLKACWDKLAKGDYDWAHLAYTIRPREVEKACEKDRSIAIAHGREDLCKIEPPKAKKGRGKKKAVEEDEEEPEMMEED